MKLRPMERQCADHVLIRVPPIVLRSDGEEKIIESIVNPITVQKCVNPAIDTQIAWRNCGAVKEKLDRPQSGEIGLACRCHLVEIEKRKSPIV